MISFEFDACLKLWGSSQCDGEKTNNYSDLWSRSESVGMHRDRVWGEVGCGDTRTGGQGLGLASGQFVFGGIGREGDCWLGSGWVGVEWV